MGGSLGTDALELLQHQSGVKTWHTQLTGSQAKQHMLIFLDAMASSSYPCHSVSES